MLPIDECRSFLPKEKEYTEEQIQKIRAQLYELGELAIKDFLRTEEQVFLTPLPPDRSG